MYEFIRIQYQYCHTLTADQVRSFAPKWITAEEYREITGEEYPVSE